MAHFLAGNRVEIRAVDGTAPYDLEVGDAEYVRLRSEMAVARLLRRAESTTRVYALIA